MKRFNLYLDDDLFSKLVAKSEETGAPVAELVRRAVRSFLDLTVPLPRGVPVAPRLPPSPAMKWVCKCGQSNLGGVFCGRCKEARP